MSGRTPIPRIPRNAFQTLLGPLICVAALFLPRSAPAAGAPSGPLVLGTVIHGEPAVLAGSAVVNFGELARQQAGRPVPPVRPRLLDLLDDDEGEPGAGFTAPPALAPPGYSPQQIQLASPPPTSSFIGLDDIPMADLGFIIIPPDVDGAVGPNRILEGLNNNYRIMDKATGSPISTVGTGTFWGPTGAPGDQLTDPRTTYDPYNNRWIAVMQTTQSSGLILVGVSQTSDPGGTWNLYSFNTGALIDFPNIGFNKNWIVVSINRYSNGGAFQHGTVLAVDYPSARAGTGVGTFFQTSAGTHFCSAPCVTYSSNSDTEYVVTHLSSGSATYSLDMITGTPGSPTLLTGGALTRPGGGWAAASGNALPQSPPNSGSSACGATPCMIEIQDAQLRSSPVFRYGTIWYAQTVGLPSSGMTHTAAQWTRITTPSGAFVDGGRLDDAGANSSNGGKWYAWASVGVNSQNDMMMGFTQFSSAQHPSAGYAMHIAADGAGTMRDPLITKNGEDYYHKTFSTTTGRNRWGDFSTTQVDPVDDQTLWTVQEYAKTRTGTDDGNSGSNSSKWSTWWAAVGAPLPVATLAPGPSLPEGNSGTTPFKFVANLSAPSSSTVTINFHTADSTATVADNDYLPLTSSIVIAPGFTTGSASVSVVGDTRCEPDEYFLVILDSAINASIGSANRSVGTILNDDSKNIAASAGAGGTIVPSGLVNVPCFGSQTFTITPNTGFSVQDVQVDGGSVGAVTSYTFNSVTTDHTIVATFINQYTLTLTSLGVGSIAASPSQPSYASGTIVHLTPNPGVGFGFSVWGGDASGSANPLNVTMDANKSISAAFPDIAPPSVAVLAPNGGESVNEGDHTTLQWTATDNQVVANVDLLLSRDGSGGPFSPIATGVPNTGSFDWVVTGPGTTTAFFEVSARDSAGNLAADTSNAAFTIVSTTAVGDGPVTVLELSPISPNPLPRGGTVNFALPHATHVHLGVYDVQGREAAVLAEGPYESGRYHVSWSGSGAVRQSGLYFVRLSAGGRTITRRAVLLR